jgi:hypothetical protein
VWGGGWAPPPHRPPSSPEACLRAWVLPGEDGRWARGARRSTILSREHACAPGCFQERMEGGRVAHGAALPSSPEACLRAWVLPGEDGRWARGVATIGVNLGLRDVTLSASEESGTSAALCCTCRTAPLAQQTDSLRLRAVDPSLALRMTFPDVTLTLKVQPRARLPSSPGSDAVAMCSSTHPNSIGVFSGGIRVPAGDKAPLHLKELGRLYDQQDTRYAIMKTT